MRRLTEYVGKYPHGRPGKTYAEAIESTDVCRGEFEATACVERLAAYEDTGLEPEEIPHWIPVSERLPDTDEYMLVACKTQKGVVTINRAYYSNGCWHGSGSMSKVTHWMPLPAAPERV